MTAKKKLPKPFTLNELIVNVDLTIRQSHEQGVPCEEIRIPPEINQSPTLPTLKLWSKNGFFKPAKDLSEATALVLERMNGRIRYYSGSDTRRVAPGMKPGIRSVQGPRPESRDESSSDLIEQVLREMKEQRERINGIEKYVANLAEAGTGAVGEQSGEVLAALAKVTNAINQLDVFRKNLMVRFDNEMQLVKQAGSGQRPFDNASALDMQRVLAKVSQLEGLIRTSLSEK